MKKPLLLFLFIGFIVLGANAQQKDTLSLFSISANGGIGVPCGYFGAPSSDASSPGYQDGANAVKGFGLNITAHIRIPGQKWFGFTTAIEYYSNAFNMNTYINGLVVNDIPSYYTHRRTYYTGSVTGTYKGYSIMGGLYFIFYHTPKLSGCLNLCIGYTENIFPELNYSEYYTTDNSFMESYTIKSSNAGAYSYQPSMELQYSVTKKWHIDLCTSFFHSKPTFSLTQSTYNPLQNPTYQQNTIITPSPVSIVGVTLGIGYCFL